MQFEYDVAQKTGMTLALFLLSDETLRELAIAESSEEFKRHARLLDRQDDFRATVREQTTTKAVTDLEDFKVKLRSYLSDLSSQTVPTVILESNGANRSVYTAEMYDSQPLLRFGASDLEPDLARALLSSEQAQTKLRERDLTHAPPERQLSALNLLTDQGVRLGSFYCLAPSRLLDQVDAPCALALTEYSEITRAASRTLALQEERDNLIRLHARGMDFLRTHLRRVGTARSSKRDELEIPVDALSEALANALIHRDYEQSGARSQPTHIDIYADRVEIISFGGLVSGISEELLNEDPEQVTPRRRNQYIQQVFSYLGLAEGRASGVARMFNLVDAADLPKPHISEERVGIQSVKVTFYRLPPEYFSRTSVEQRPDGVFVSSVYDELIAFRRAAVDAVWRSDLHAIGMERGDCSGPGRGERLTGEDGLEGGQQGHALLA